MASTAIQRSVLRWRKGQRTFSTNVAGDFDVVIIGGGPVGLALASGLVSKKPIRESLKIALVEAGSLSNIRNWTLPSSSYSNRVSSITNVSRRFLEAIGVWAHVDQSRTCPIQKMQVWDGLSDSRIIFDAADLPAHLASSTEPNEMARLTENLNLQRALLRHLDATSCTELLQNTKVSSIRHDCGEEGRGWPLVDLSDGTTLRARLLVGADGFNSPVRAFADIASYGWSYDAQAVVATLHHAPRSALQDPNHTAYQRFLPTGPLAFLPLSSTTSSLVWSTKPQLATALCRSGPSVLASMVNAAFRLPEVSVRYLHQLIVDADRAGSTICDEDIRDEIAFRERSHNIPRHSGYASVSSALSTGVPPHDAEAVPPLVISVQPETIASFPLRYSHAESYLGEGLGSRTVLIGDAAHTIHPLAGQGLNLGLGDVDCLVRCITQSAIRGGDIGSYTALRPYAAERYFANHKVMSAVDKLHKLYSSTLEPVVWVRSVGLEVLNELDSVKTALMMDAGASSSGSLGWKDVARGIEGLAGVLRTGGIFGQGFGSMVNTTISELSKSVGRRLSG